MGTLEVYWVWNMQKTKSGCSVPRVCLAEKTFLSSHFLTLVKRNRGQYCEGTSFCRSRITKILTSTRQVWSTETLETLYIIHPYMGEGAGDIFSLSWSPSLQTIFIGCQNTSLQWFDFHEPISRSVSASSVGEAPSGPSSGTSTPINIPPRQAHKFFDSYPQYERKAADIHAKNSKHGRGSPDSDRSDISGPGEYLSIPASNVIDSAHYGYIYTMALLNGDQGIQLATGSGDETVKVLHSATLS